MIPGCAATVPPRDRRAPEAQGNARRGRQGAVDFLREDAVSQQAAATVEEPLAEIARRRSVHQAKKPKRQPRYNVILLDDDHHSYAYVMVMLQMLFGHPLEKGYLLATEVDTSGRVIVLTTTREHAELKRDQIHAFGKDDLIAGCQGSMSSVIEPVSDDA